MNLPDILNLALGLVVLYVLLSSIASLLLELITGAAQYREEILYVTVNRLLAGEPDTPWNIRRLVLHRIGQHFFKEPGRLRHLLVTDYKIIAPGRIDDGSGPEDIVQRFWRHPKIRSLTASGADAPQSLDAGTFAAVVIDIAIPRDAQQMLPDNRLVLQRALAAPNDHTPPALLKTLSTLGLSSEIPAGATGDALWVPFRANLATWFTEASARSTDFYRRTMRTLLLWMGLVLALALNADSFTAIQRLSHDRPLREALAAYAATVNAETQTSSLAPAPKNPPAPAPNVTAPTALANTVTAPAPTTPATGNANQPVADTAATATSDLRKTRLALASDIERLRALEDKGFPLGWGSAAQNFPLAAASYAWAHRHPNWPFVTAALVLGFLGLVKFAGLLATGLAVSQGAPFWYDLLNRIVGLRKGLAPDPAPAKPDPSAKTTAGGVTNQVANPTPLPLEIGHDLSAPGTSFDARKAYWLARASAAAYSPPSEIETLVKTTWRFHDYAFFDRQGTQCFCAADDKVLLIAFRGTELADLNDDLADLKAVPTALKFADYAGAPARQVHAGFHAALDLVWADLSKKILALTAPSPGSPARQIFLTGHSLGGALATLLFARLAAASGRPVPTLYTFGCPKVGDQPFVRELDRLYPERVFRFINDSDIVPQLPPLPVYEHAGRQFSFDADGKLRTEISGLSRLLGYAAAAAKSIREASRKAVDDHGIAHYVARCEALAKSA